ncbi:NAD(P)H-quinone dehydrogenase [Natronoglycomyces albus]|uniref:NAD(P)H-quinone dehydrogenase n=1 Tax=Natronoglycomyces albus TaxID=2811108 RepID=A0A895XR18_9ACTN|nr:NAD(P)H-quinone dehydrogenase [Natronoglycomyces albus]QSB05006.1 NAD(P)H-quinone dehydrogenase [Natronoglycomyces albus]
MTRVAIIGGGPAGYEAALVAAQLDAEVTLIEETGVGGACVVSDCVPSKTFIASSNVLTEIHEASDLGVMVEKPQVDATVLYNRVKRLARQQSTDIAAKVLAAGVTVVDGRASLCESMRDAADATGSHFTHRVSVQPSSGDGYTIDVDVVLLATGSTPRELPSAKPDGERILTWRQVYDLDELPERLVVVGSGVTGAEFASAYLAMGSEVTLISSREHVMPHEDADAAQAIETVFQNRGMDIRSRSRAEAVRRTDSGVEVELTDGTIVRGSHALITVGSIPNSRDMNLEAAGVHVNEYGYITVDKVSRTNLPGIYAAGDVTGVQALASVAAMQGRIAMWHALGEAVRPLKLSNVAANVFTDPELASVGVSQKAVDDGKLDATVVMLPLASNARAKMSERTEGFVKLICRAGSGLVAGGVIVAPRASELITPIALAVEQRLTVEQVARTLTIYPSLSGSIAEAARQLVEYEN